MFDFLGGKNEHAKKRIDNYNLSDLKEIINSVTSGMSNKATSKNYGVRRSTWQFCLSDKFAKSSMGFPPVLTKEEEQLLAKQMTGCSRKGFPKRKLDMAGERLSRTTCQRMDWSTHF
jgi:hypothetical protein